MRPPFESRPAPRRRAADPGAGRQQSLARLLDTRIACLMVDHPDTQILRRDLYRLRERLTRERLGRRTLREVEAAMRELGPRGVPDVGGGSGRIGRRPAPHRVTAAGGRHRAMSGVAALCGAALLLTQIGL